MHLWHDISVGNNPPENLNVIIEIPQGSKVKYELDKETGLIKLDRILYSSVHYPLNYGFVPQTYCDDKDPLDALVLTQYPLVCGTLLEATPIGVIKMIDGGEGDDKLLTVATGDPQMSHIKDLNDISPHQLEEIKNFFETYKMLQKKEVIIEAILPKKQALEVLEQSIVDYKNQKF